LGVTAVAALVLSALIGLPGVIYAKVMVLLAYWGLAGFICSLVLKRPISTLLMMIAPPVLTIGTIPLLMLMSWLTPATFDYYLYAFDGSYGFQPAFVAAQIVQDTGWLGVLTEACYVNLPVAMTILYCVERQSNPAAANRFLRLILLLPVIGFAGYYLFPAVGTVVVFGSKFPVAPPPLADVAVRQIHAIADPRNCVPSLHTGWALSIWWSSMRLRPLATYLFAAYTFFTLVYTLSSGHYLVDMIVALPFTVLIYALSLDIDKRGVLPEMAACAAMLFGWLLFLRFGEQAYLASRAVPWALTIATCVGSALILVRVKAREAEPR
jgi:hypothetical protein